MKFHFSLIGRAKSRAAFMVLTAFMTVALFGFLFMGHHQRESAAHASPSCIAGIFEGGDCEEAAPLDFIAFHFRAFKTFSTAVFFVLSIVTIAFVLFRIRERLLLFNPVTAPPSKPTVHFRSSSFPYHAEYYRWLALHKKRDPFRS